MDALFGMANSATVSDAAHQIPLTTGIDGVLRWCVGILVSNNLPHTQETPTIRQQWTLHRHSNQTAADSPMWMPLDVHPWWMFQMYVERPLQISSITLITSLLDHHRSASPRALPPHLPWCILVPMHSSLLLQIKSPRVMYSRLHSWRASWVPSIPRCSFPCATHCN